jgi:hypothetical protein
MKSAYELALSRFGGELEELSPEQKEQIAEVTRLYQSKMAAAELSAQERLKRAEGDAAAAERVGEELAIELASLREKEARDKKKIREGE